MTVPVPILRMGKYKGKRFNKVPVDHLRSLLNLPHLWQQTRDQIEAHLRLQSHTTSSPQTTKKDKVEHKPQYFKKPAPPPTRTEEGKARFREQSRLVKERLYGKR